MDRITVKTRVVVLEFNSFCALIMTCRLVTTCDGVPEILPVLVFSVSPEGKDPEVIEYSEHKPVMTGFSDTDDSKANV